MTARIVLGVLIATLLTGVSISAQSSGGQGSESSKSQMLSPTLTGAAQETLTRYGVPVCGSPTTAAGRRWAGRCCTPR